MVVVYFFNTSFRKRPCNKYQSKKSSSFMQSFNGVHFYMHSFLKNSLWFFKILQTCFQIFTNFQGVSKLKKCTTINSISILSSVFILIYVNQIWNQWFNKHSAFFSTTQQKTFSFVELDQKFNQDSWHWRLYIYVESGGW